MSLAIGAGESRCRHSAAIPAGDIVGVGMSRMMDVSHTGVDGITEVLPAPVAILMIQPHEVIILINTRCGISVITMSTNEKL